MRHSKWPSRLTSNHWCQEKRSHKQLVRSIPRLSALPSIYWVKSTLWEHYSPWYICVYSQYGWLWWKSQDGAESPRMETTTCLWKSFTTEMFHPIDVISLQGIYVQVQKLWIVMRKLMSMLLRLTAGCDEEEKHKFALHKSTPSAPTAT